MPHQHLPREGMKALEKKLAAENTAADTTLFPFKGGTSEFAQNAKDRFDVKIDELKAEMGPELFDKYCAASFVCLFDDDMGACDGTEGRTGALMMMMATIVLRLADVTVEAQRFRPQRDSLHKIVAGIVHRLMQMTLVMVPDSGTPVPEEKKDTGIIIPE